LVKLADVFYPNHPRLTRLVLKQVDKVVEKSSERLLTAEGKEFLGEELELLMNSL